MRVRLPLILLAIMTGCAARPMKLAPSLDAQPLTKSVRDDYLRSFDEIYVRVSDTFPDRLRLAEINWASAPDAYRPRIEAARTRGGARNVLRELLDSLGESHFALIPSELYTAADTNSSRAGRRERGELGLTVRLLVDQPIVTDVSGAAEAAGIRPGWVLTEIAGQPPLEEFVRRMRDALPPTRLSDVQIAEAIDALLEPDVAQRARLTFRDGNGRARTITLVARTPVGTVAQLGNLPPMPLRLDTHRIALDDDDSRRVLYLSFGVFLEPATVFGALIELLDNNPDAAGLIIDLRGNGGGIGSMASGLLGFLLDVEALHRTGSVIGSMKQRDGDVPFVVRPRLPHFTGPVAVLVDGRSMSTSEIFARAIQDTGRGRVFGQPTPGAALPSLVIRLPNGDGFQYAIADYITARGERLEGVGVTPDELVPLDRSAILALGDPTLQAALRWIDKSVSR